MAAETDQDELEQDIYASPPPESNKRKLDVDAPIPSPCKVARGDIRTSPVTSAPIEDDIKPVIKSEEDMVDDEEVALLEVRLCFCTVNRAH